MIKIIYIKKELSGINNALIYTLQTINRAQIKKLSGYKK